MKNKHCRSWIILSKLKNVENKKQTLYELQYAEGH